MNSEVLQIIKPIKFLLIALLIEFIVVFAFFTTLYSNYNQNLFDVRINGQEMNCYYSEKYSNGFLINATSSGYNSVESRINSIDLGGSFNLEIKEFEVYYKDGIRKQDNNGWFKENDLDYKEVNNSNIKLEIKRVGKVIYNGDYISDISKYISEKGRYYIHIYVIRKDAILSSVKTHISFNVIIGGGNNETTN